MLSKLLLVLGAAVIACSVQAHEDHSKPQKPATVSAPAGPRVALDAHTQEDIQRHLNMARAHEQAAQCLSAGTAHDECQRQLQQNCRGLAIGKQCGMRHAH